MGRSTIKRWNAMVGRPHVVIIGAGFGGLWAAKGLAKADVDVTVIDRHNYHLFQPLLYQVASAGLAATDVAWPIRAILGRQANATVLMDEVTGIDRKARLVTCRTHTAIPFDYLVVATGARHAYFGHDEWEACAPGLKNVDDALGIRRRVLQAFERAESASSDELRERLLTFAVVGAGPTGVEMAGALAELAHSALVRDFRHIDPQHARIVLVEAGSRVLSSFPQALSAYAHKALGRLGVEVRLGEAVTHCGGDGVMIGTTRLPAGTVVWAAGVQASPAARWLGAGADRSGRVVVDNRLALPDDEAIFVIGDAARVVSATGAPVPGIAPAAKQQGNHVARTIRLRYEKRKDAGEFHYRHHGSLATIGRYAAVIDFGRIRLKGWVAWWLWGIVHIYFLIGVRSPMLVATEWLWSYLTFASGARVIVGDRTNADAPHDHDETTTPTEPREARNTL